MIVTIDAIDRVIGLAVAVDDVCDRFDRQDGCCCRCCRWCLRSMQSMIVAVDGIDAIDDRFCERRLSAYAHWYSLDRIPKELKMAPGIPRNSSGIPGGIIPSENSSAATYTWLPAIRNN